MVAPRVERGPGSIVKSEGGLAFAGAAGPSGTDRVSGIGGQRRRRIALDLPFGVGGRRAEGELPFDLGTFERADVATLRGGRRQAGVGGIADGGGGGDEPGDDVPRDGPGRERGIAGRSTDG